MSSRKPDHFGRMIASIESRQWPAYWPVNGGSLPIPVRSSPANGLVPSKIARAGWN
jgi:hypothetical protein